MNSGLKNDQNRPKKDPRYRPTISRLVNARIRDLLRHGDETISMGEVEKCCIRKIPPDCGENSFFHPDIFFTDNRAAGKENTIALYPDTMRQNTVAPPAQSSFSQRATSGAYSGTCQQTRVPRTIGPNHCRSCNLTKRPLHPPTDFRIGLFWKVQVPIRQAARQRLYPDHSR